ncbi:hypothetical protein Pint_26458 [Pistacia integerrima]|uniref:Uncharacterized protein n=1 Tax=Pistacia integerrima TaxID=434235 RepID=A0ACC0YE63_9ROSI|nr:hypothetical protein Pint_26458 [Pistacia integerrima]
MDKKVDSAVAIFGFQQPLARVYELVFFSMYRFWQISLGGSLEFQEELSLSGAEVWSGEFGHLVQKCPSLLFSLVGRFSGQFCPLVCLLCAGRAICLLAEDGYGAGVDLFIWERKLWLWLFLQLQPVITCCSRIGWNFAECLFGIWIYMSSIVREGWKIFAILGLSVGIVIFPIGLVSFGPGEEEDYPLFVEDDDPDWSKDADGWGFSLGQFSNKITIKNVKKDDDDAENYDSENEIVWKDDNYIYPIKDIKDCRKECSKTLVLQFFCPKENKKIGEKIEKAVHITWNWNCRPPSPRVIDANVEHELLSALQVSVFPEVIFTKAGKILQRE